MAKKKPAAAKRAAPRDATRKADAPKPSQALRDSPDEMMKKGLDALNQIKAAHDEAEKYTGKFNVGDVVMLKSGGPAMTVSATSTKVGPTPKGFKASGVARVTWAQGGSIYSENYCFSTLAPFDPAHLQNLP
jgi:uncharacterized protein YodC (DUF2158 family)